MSMNGKGGDKLNEGQGVAVSGEIASDASGRAAIDAILERPARLGRSSSGDDGPRQDRIDGIVIGRVVEADQAAGLTVDFEGNRANRPLAALSAVDGTGLEPGADVALAFVAGDPQRPIVLGAIQHPGSASRKALDIEVDGEQVRVTAEKELVLRCGEASITLTKAGKILIKGTYVSTQSAGVNRIKGGSVQVN